jgi:quercetin dioxygenase-like cupin family protein
VKLVPFDPTHAITQFDSSGANIAGVARCAGEARVSLLRLDAGGVVGEHPAASPQLFLVVAGSGWVRVAGADRSAIEPGQAAVWEAGERHESGSDGGLTAVVVEADSVELL